jgi:ankyrin repeat protein
VYATSQREDILTDILKLLLQSGADANVVKGVSGQTALHCVLECDYKSGYNKFFCSQIADLLLEHMAVVDIQDILGYTPLMWAARWEYPVIVHKLLDRGADVSHADKYYKRNALHWGAFGTARTCNQVVASILAHGVQDIDVGYKHGTDASRW